MAYHACVPLSGGRPSWGAIKIRRFCHRLSSLTGNHVSNGNHWLAACIRPPSKQWLKHVQSQRLWRHHTRQVPFKGNDRYGIMTNFSIDNSFYNEYFNLLPWMIYELNQFFFGNTVFISSPYSNNITSRCLNSPWFQPVWLLWYAEWHSFVQTTN